MCLPQVNAPQKILILLILYLKRVSLEKAAVYQVYKYTIGSRICSTKEDIKKVIKRIILCDGEKTRILIV